MKNWLTNLLHRHKWNLIYSFTSSNKMYGHDHHYCECGTHRHIKRLWNKKPIIKFHKENIQK
jgi:hypothetical protein